MVWHTIAVLGNKMDDVSLKLGQKMDAIFYCNGQLAQKGMPAPRCGMPNQMMPRQKDLFAGNSRK